MSDYDTEHTKLAENDDWIILKSADSDHVDYSLVYKNSPSLIRDEVTVGRATGLDDLKKKDAKAKAKKAKKQARKAAVSLHSLLDAFLEFEKS